MLFSRIYEERPFEQLHTNSMDLSFLFLSFLHCIRTIRNNSVQPSKEREIKQGKKETSGKRKKKMYQEFRRRKETNNEKKYNSLETEECPLAQLYALSPKPQNVPPHEKMRQTKALLRLPTEHHLDSASKRTIQATIQAEKRTIQEEYGIRTIQAQ